jgi:hypothetical protein
MSGSQLFAPRPSRAFPSRREQEEAFDRMTYQYRRQGGSPVPDVRATRGTHPMMDPSVFAGINQIETREAQAAAAILTADSRSDGYF